MENNIKETFKVRNIVLEMLEDRKYDTKGIAKLTYDEFTVLYKLNNINIFIDPKNKRKGMLVYFHNSNNNLTKSEFKSIIKNIYNKYTNNINIILIVKKINNIIKNELNKYIYSNIELFLNKNLFFNITKHFLVPKHIPLTEKEKKTVMDKYNVTEEQIPKILLTDPVVKYYGMKLGQLCKIVRINKFTGDDISYRIVTNIDSI